MCGLMNSRRFSDFDTRHKMTMKHLLLALLLLVSVIGPAVATDVSITAANVVPSASADIRETTAGATIAAGQLIYLDSADLDAQSRGKAKLSDANGASALRVVDGIAVNSASAGQRIHYVVNDPALVIAASGLTTNQILILSATAGGVAPSADLTTGWYLSVIGVVKSGTTISVRFPAIASGASS